MKCKTITFIPFTLDILYNHVITNKLQWSHIELIWNKFKTWKAFLQSVEVHLPFIRILAEPKYLGLRYSKSGDHFEVEFNYVRWLHEYAYYL